jgi:hypothetical protein
MCALSTARGFASRIPAGRNGCIVPISQPQAQQDEYKANVHRRDKSDER